MTRNVQQSLRKAQTQNKINNKIEQLLYIFLSSGKTKYFYIIKVESEKCIELSIELEKKNKNKFVRIFWRK